MLKSALILVDLQNDFCPGGSLAVPHGDEVIAIANQWQLQFELVIATQDWHPQDHCSFAANHPGHNVGDLIMIQQQSQRLWPVHCVQESSGAEFHPQLNTSRIHKIIHKGTDKKIDSYSTFYDNAHLRSTGLGEYLKAQQVTDLYLMGLATDYCVKFSCLDAVHLGFRVHLIAHGCRGVDLSPGDSARAIEEMKKAGVIVV